MVRIGDLNWEFTRIADPDRVLDDVAAEADRREKVNGKREPDEHLHLPYWAELWESAIGMGQFLDANFRLQWTMAAVPARILDLGCGMGMSGAVAAALGASVLFADIETPALLFAQLNSAQWHDRVRTRRLNWQVDRLAERFDLILGADILYERAQWQHLEPFWQHHLEPGGSVLLGEPGRQTGDLFAEWITQHGWELSVAQEKVPTREKPVRVMQLRIKT